MKNSAIIRIISWSIVALALLFVLLAGMSGKLPFFAFNIGTSYNYDHSSQYSIADGTITAGNVDDIDIDWVSGNVNIEEYDGEEVIFSESSRNALDDADKMRYYIRDNRLIIKFCEPRRVFPRIDHLSKELTLKVPYGHPLANLDIDAVSASVYVANISANKMNIGSVSGGAKLSDITADIIDVENVSGEVQLQNATSRIFTAESVSGKIKAESKFNHVKCSTVSGSISLAPGKDIESLGIETVSGNAEIKLPEDIDGFKVKHSSISGDMSCNFPGQSDKKLFIYQSGRAEFNIETVSGDIDVIKQ